MTKRNTDAPAHRPPPDPVNSPPYDQWRRAILDTGSYQLVTMALDLTADLRTWDITREGEERAPSAASPPRRRKRKASDQKMFDAVAHAVVSALVRRELIAPGRWTCVPLSNIRLGREGRYRSLAMSRSLPQFLRALERAGWLELVVGRAGKRIRESSTMRASLWLVGQMQSLRCKLTDFRREGEELVVLKGERPPGRDRRGEPFKAEWLDYSDTPETDRMRAEMREVNAWLDTAAIEYLGSGVDLSDRQLHRVFNRGSFKSGGRLFGGFWMNASMGDLGGHPWRGHIRIEGEPIVVVDYSATFLRLMYAEAGLQAPAGDLYADIEGLTALGAEYRTAAKQLVSAMISSRSELTRRPKKFEPLLPPRAHIKTLANNIKRRHPEIAHLFGQDMSGRLMHIESEILLEVLRRCRAEGLIALPVHDAVIVRESHAHDAKRIMLAAFHHVTGFRGEVGAKRPSADAAELETIFEPADEVGEPEEWRRVTLSLRGGHQDIARIMATQLLEAPRPVETPDAEGDWV